MTKARHCEHTHYGLVACDRLCLLADDRHHGDIASRSSGSRVRRQDGRAGHHSVCRTSGSTRRCSSTGVRGARRGWPQGGRPAGDQDLGRGWCRRGVRRRGWHCSATTTTRQHCAATTAGQHDARLHGSSGARTCCCARRLDAMWLLKRAAAPGRGELVGRAIPCDEGTAGEATAGYKCQCNTSWKQERSPASLSVMRLPAGRARPRLVGRGSHSTPTHLRAEGRRSRCSRRRLRQSRRTR